MKKLIKIAKIPFLISCISMLSYSCFFLKKNNKIKDEISDIGSEESISQTTSDDNSAYEITTTKIRNKLKTNSAQIGDFVLKNSKITLLIGGNSRSEERGNLFAIYNNSSILNILKRYSLFIRKKEFYFAEYNKIKIVTRGGSGIPSSIMATGNIKEHKSIIVTTTYSLNESDSFVKVETTLINKGQKITEEFSIGDIAFWNSEDIFIPDSTHEDLLFRTLPCTWLAAFLDNISCGIFPTIGSAECTVGTNWTESVYRRIDNLDGTPITFQRNLIVGNGDTTTLQKSDDFYRGVKKKGIYGRVIEDKKPIENAKIFFYQSKDQAKSRPLGFTLSDENGNFFIEADQKPFQIRAYDKGRNPTNFITIPPELTKLEITMEKRGKALFQIFDNTDKLIPAKLIFGNQNKIADDFTIYSEDGRGEIFLPAGKYTVTVTHGLEYSSDVSEILIESGNVTQFTSKVSKLIHNNGYFSCDFNQHGENSIDSTIKHRDRIISNVAEGLDIFVSSDHDSITDFAEDIEELKLQDSIKSIKGIEIASESFGNFTIFPVEKNENSFTIENEKRTEELLQSVKKSSSLKVAQINQPQSKDVGYFNRGERIESDAKANDESSKNFNTVEILNLASLREENIDEKKILGDWFLLLNMGAMITATGSAESHTLREGSCTTYPRNVLYLGSYNLNEIKDEAVVDSVINKKNLSITTGHFLEFKINDKPIGSVVNIPLGSELKINIKISAVPWIDLDTVTLYKNGEKSESWEVKKNSDSVLRFEKELKVKIEKDSWFVLTSKGNKTNKAICDLLPFAVSNPIWVRVK